MNSVQFVTAVADWLLADPAHIVLAASALAALTPTPEPGSLAGKLYRIVDLLALNVLRAKDQGVSAAPAPAPVAPQPDPGKARQGGFARLFLAGLVALLGAAVALSGCAGVQSVAVAANHQAVQATLIAGHDELVLGKELICSVPYQTAVDAMAADATLAGSLPSLCPAIKSVPVATKPVAGN
jgi:hypothetical protein